MKYPNSTPLFILLYMFHKPCHSQFLTIEHSFWTIYGKQVNIFEIS